MEQSLPILLTTAFVIGVSHTFIGPDHYLPFIVLSRAGGWSLGKTLWWTFVCGLGHVGSSVLVGALGIAFGWQVSGMEGFEGIRGEIAGYALILFGGAYLLYGLYRERGGRSHHHAHVHTDGAIHTHEHAHQSPSSHGHRHQESSPPEEKATLAQTKSFWAVFIIFVLGPCEPLIPLLMVPAAAHSAQGIAAVTAAFALATIGVMLAIVWMGYKGLNLLRFNFPERHIHALSGGAILVSGLLIRFAGI